MNIRELMSRLENWMPRRHFESWDNNGLVLGDVNAPVKKVMLCMDINQDVLNEAVKNGVDTIISHHPMIFHSIKKFDLNDSRVKLIFEAEHHGISLLAYHTAYDLALGGTHDYLAEIFGLENIEPIEPVYTEKYYQISIYVPQTHEAEVRAAIAKAGAGRLGDYDTCSFTYEGTGRFKPLENAKPFLGQVDEIEEVHEAKIEAIVSAKDLAGVVESMRAAHPYEEVAYNILELANLKQTIGHGRLGTVEPISLQALCEKTKVLLGCDYVKAYGDMQSIINVVALSAGSGEDFIPYLNSGIDVFITGDLKTNKVLELVDKGIAVIDAGHYETERPCIEHFKTQLERLFPELELMLCPREIDNTTKHTIV